MNSSDCRVCDRKYGSHGQRLRGKIFEIFVSRAYARPATRPPRRCLRSGVQNNRAVGWYSKFVKLFSSKLQPSVKAQQIRGQRDLILNKLADDIRAPSGGRTLRVNGSVLGQSRSGCSDSPPPSDRLPFAQGKPILKIEVEFLPFPTARSGVAERSRKYVCSVQSESSSVTCRHRISTFSPSFWSRPVESRKTAAS